MDTIFVNGTVGSGKTTLVDALSRAETRPHAVIDLDSIRRLVPPPDGDPFAQELELENLRSLARNYRRAGAARFVLAGVIERRGDVERYASALESDGMFCCRLEAPLEELEARLRRRHADDPEALSWHLGRVRELAAILRRADVDDLVLDSTSASPPTLAALVRRAAGWA